MTHVTNFKWDKPTRTDAKIAKEAAEDAQWRACKKAVDLRDRRQCRACGKKTDPEAIGLTKKGHRHHIEYRSHMGLDVPENVITLCSVCHDAVHVKRTMRVEGNASEGVIFWKKDDDGAWFMWKRELDVHRTERD